MTTTKYVMSAFMLTTDLKEKIRREAYKKRKKQSQIVREAIIEYLKQGDTL